MYVVDINADDCVIYFVIMRTPEQPLYLLPMFPI